MKTFSQCFQIRAGSAERKTERRPRLAGGPNTDERGMDKFVCTSKLKDNPLARTLLPQERKGWMNAQLCGLIFSVPFGQ
jgi:hypothetical protein